MILRFLSHIIPALLLVIGCYAEASAQRNVTPVQQKSSQLNTAEGKKAAQQLIEKNVRPSLIFGDSIINLEEFTKKDTAKGPANLYPRIYSVAVGVNIWDPLMRIFGQKYGLFDINAEMSFHNRFQTIMELGLGKANSTPDGMNFTYTTPLSFYGKVGGSYNFLYNSDPSYRFTAGLLLGYSAFHYSIEDVSVKSDYWGQQTGFSINNQHSHALWAEFALGLRVKIYDRLFMGWNIRYRFMINYGKNQYGAPWYIPGMGARNQNIGGSFSIYYVLPLNKKYGLSKDETIAEQYSTFVPPVDSDTGIAVDP